jgi:hypothetical protein
MSDQTYTSDLRSDAKGFNRDKNSRVKWTHGQSYGPGRREEDARPRPARVIPNVKYVHPPANKLRYRIRLTGKGRSILLLPLAA